MLTARPLRSSLLLSCLAAGCAAAPPPTPTPIHRAAYGGVSLGALPVAPVGHAPGPAPLSLYLLLENTSGPQIVVDPADFSLGPVHGSACSPVTVEPVAAARPGGVLYAQAGRALPQPAAPARGPALLDLELPAGSLDAPGRTAGVLTFPCAERGGRRPLLLRWRLRDAVTGRPHGEIDLPVLPR